MSLPAPYYERDGITIYHSRCEDIIPHVAPSSVDLLLTDPPYGISVVQRNNRARNGDFKPGHVEGTWKSWEYVEGDDECFDPRPLMAYEKIALFGANNFAHLLPPSQSWIVWDRLNGATPHMNADAELIWTNLGGTIRSYRQCWRGFSRENDSLEPNHHVHPTQKPVNLMMWLIEKYTKPDDLIFDPYMGSGPIAHACHLLGRRYIGVELVESYCAVAVRRLQQSVMRLEVPA